MISVEGFFFIQCGQIFWQRHLSFSLDIAKINSLRDRVTPPIDLTTVPSVYHDLHGEVLSLRPHQPYDCAIELLPVCVQSTQ